MSNIQAGLTLGDRYVIVRQLGQGGFGRTYLVEDINRFRELCVLKEFSPLVQTESALKKAQELFQREASVLYKLQHPQIPRFREQFHINLAGKEYLFLVQDYVEGLTYNAILYARKQQGLRFTELEIRQFLQQILPVLSYIHALGVIHRDISPDNIILRTVDQLPVLIDFGGVKQVVAASQYYQPGVAAPPAATLLGKAGFAPPEQMQTGAVSPHSDLYALAATTIVLLTGKQPQELLDNYNLSWQWRREITLSPLLGQILDQMLAPRPSDRYQSAQQVLEALNPQPVYYPPTQPPVPIVPPTSPTIPVAAQPPAPPVVHPEPKGQRTSTKTVLAIVALAVTGGLIWWGVTGKRENQVIVDSTVTPTPTVTQTNNPSKYSLAERRRKQRLSDRQQQLAIDSNFYVNLVNQIFWEQNPSLQGRTLSDEPVDADLRTKWDQIAEDLLEKLAPLSTRARRQLGTYTAAERDRWKVEVNQINVSSRALYDLGDAAFFNAFPERKGQDFIDQPIGQVWHAFVSDKLSAMQAGSALQKVLFDTGAITKSLSGNLKAGGGKVFIADFAQNQTLDFQITANPKVLLSVYSPSGKITYLEDSSKRTLATELSESGFYEFVVVSTAATTTDYQLSFTVENSAQPAPTPTPTETSTPTLTITPTEIPTPN